MKVRFFAALIIFPALLFSQRKSDLGLCFGTAYYMGDVNPIIPFYSPGIDLGIVYRYNFNVRYVFKLEANYMKLGANDADFADDFQLARNQVFNIPAYDFAAQFEFNFLPLKFVARKFGLSPFVSTGVADKLMQSNSQVTNSIVLPFALGLRSTVGENWSIGLQWNFRKTFDDKLDGIENLVDENLKTSIHNNDWYFFANIFITYKIFNSKDDCPAYDKDL